ncbi:MAG: hypothetical protein GF401_20190 [Chitinivibrionales bacterium]|nr:hypothetical protein [Chitinivibrionales bacterium]
MRNFLIFVILCAVIALAVIIGRVRNDSTTGPAPIVQKKIPHIGRIEILNGCGVNGAAWETAELLRNHGFDVKNDGIGNAPTFNYPATLVVSRIEDMSIARQIGKVLDVDPDKVILMKNDNDRFDVTVYLGADIEGKEL